MSFSHRIGHNHGNPAARYTLVNAASSTWLGDTGTLSEEAGNV
jgi:hypothetical protein